jgi:hypothetical protein
LSSPPWTIAPTCHSDHAPPVDSLAPSSAALRGDAMWAPYAKLLAYGMAVSGRRSDPAPPQALPDSLRDGRACLPLPASCSACGVRAVVLLDSSFTSAQVTRAWQRAIMDIFAQENLTSGSLFFELANTTPRPSTLVRGAAGSGGVRAGAARGSASPCRRRSSPRPACSAASVVPSKGITFWFGWMASDD